MIKRATRWAMLTAIVSVVVAIMLGVLALTWQDDEEVESAAGPVEGNYAFTSTTLLPAMQTLTGRVGQPLEVSVNAGRLAIGADNHVFWSLQITWPFDPTRSGRLSCEGSFDRATGTITPSPRFGFSDFPPVMDRREVQNIVYNLFCAAADTTDAKPVAVTTDVAGLHLRGPAGRTTWRRE